MRYDLIYLTGLEYAMDPSHFSIISCRIILGRDDILDDL